MGDKFTQIGIDQEDPDNESAEPTPESIEEEKAIKRAFIKVSSSLLGLISEMEQEYQHDVSPDPEIIEFLLTQSTEGIKNIAFITVLFMQMKKNELIETGIASPISKDQFLQTAKELMEQPGSIQTTIAYQEAIKSFSNSQS